MILSAKRKVGLAIVVLAVGTAAQGIPPATALNADEIIHQAVQRASNSPLNNVATGYTYTKVNVTEELDGKGKVKQRKRRVFQVSFQAGTSWVKLLEVDGHRPAEADLKYQAETQSSMHQLFGRPNSGEENHDSLLTCEVTARFDFTMTGRTFINGREAYQIHFAPKASGPPAHRMLDHLLDRISGTLCIDSQEYEVARADIELGSEVDFLGGVLGCLRKLAYTMTRVRVGDGIWLHSISCGDFEGRKLLDSMRIRTKSECTNFRLMAANK